MILVRKQQKARKACLIHMLNYSNILSCNIDSSKTQTNKMRKILIIAFVAITTVSYSQKEIAWFDAAIKIMYGSSNIINNAVIDDPNLNYDLSFGTALGFGGKPHFQYLNSNVVNHCFPLSGDPNQVDAFGLEHLMGLYNKALTCVELAGPTHFSPIIREAMNIAQSNNLEGSNTYQILLILTRLPSYGIC